MNWIAEHWGISIHIQLKIIYSVSILLIIGTLRIGILKILYKRVRSPAVRYYWKKGIKYVSLVLELLIISGIWINEFGSLATYFGLLSTGLAIALKDLISNFFGWLFIVIRTPFSIGDRIQVGTYSGDVVDIRIFQFTLNEISNWVDGEMSTGRIIHFPNGKVFTEPQANYTQGFSYIWSEISVMVTFESDWKRAKEILTKIVETHAAHLN